VSDANEGRVPRRNRRGWDGRGKSWDASGVSHAGNGTTRRVKSGIREVVQDLKISWGCQLKRLGKSRTSSSLARVKVNE